MKQFIEKTSKAYVFEFDEIFPAYKQISELLGGKIDISMNYSPLDGGNITVMTHENNTVRVYPTQVLMIRDGILSSVGTSILGQRYEEINKEKILIKEIVIDKPTIYPQIENAPPLISILSLQSNFDVADVIQALIDGERFPNCGDSVIENLKQIKFNRPADTQREIEHIIMGFCDGDKIQDFIPQLASKINA